MSRKVHLKPCPICGEKAEIYKLSLGQYVIKCSSCPTDFGRLWFWNEEDAVTRWNNRISICEDKVEKIGKWLEGDGETISGVCSSCGWKSHFYEDDVVGMDYCPNCGFKMEK